MNRKMAYNFIHQLIFTLVLIGSLSAQDQNSQSDEKLFSTIIAPSFEQSCIRCHNESKSRGGLKMDSAAGLSAGSENGPVIKPGKPDESRLLEVISGDKPEMPQQDKPLEQNVVAAVRAWIASGARWPQDFKLSDKSDIKQQKHWSLEPLTDRKHPALPASHKGWARNPIDNFIAAAHAQHGFTPTKEANRQTLIRRLSFDLTGLPPEPSEVHAFEADLSADYYDKLVSRLLDSSGYGERWARHWLDIVHYGETHGYDKDKPRPNSWPYRDYVIKSLNEGKPYSQFVREQIAGDVLYPESPEAVKGLGFLAAGPWDFIGHAEVPESKIDGRVARHLDRDDMVGTTVGTLLSLTIQCAQCHDHKFDPVKQTDYYSLQAVFAGIDRADRPYFKTSDDQLKYERINQRKLQLIREISRLKKEIELQAGSEYSAWQQRIASAGKKGSGNSSPQFGYHSAVENDRKLNKWVQLNFSEAVEISRVVLAPCSDDFNSIGDGFGFPLRYKIETAENKDFTKNVRFITDQTGSDQPNPGIEPQLFQQFEPLKSQFLRITATRLASRGSDFHFALAEVGIFDSHGINHASKATITALDSVEAAPRWQKTNLVDGISPGGLVAIAKKSEKPDQVREEFNQWLKKRVSADVLDSYQKCTAELNKIENEIKSIRPAGLVYAGTVHSGSGAFEGTGKSGGVPRRIFRLNRGDVRQPFEEVSPGTIESLKFATYQLAKDEAENESLRRLHLAEWITSPDNPLFWRSIVNRVWQYHFGRGLVDTPGDFGRMGSRPTHPELLDYLSVWFRDSGGKLKDLHRLIVTSATYRQASIGNSEYALHDSSNAFLWRQNRRKLEAEAVRDSILAVSGKLNRQMGGPSFQDFLITHPEHSPHYEYDRADPNDPKLHRRSIYRFIVRSQPQPFLTTMDCADPSIRVDRRNESVSAAQALAQWNESLVLAISADFGNWIDRQPGNDDEKVSIAFEKCLSRRPVTDELKSLVMFSRKYGHAALARLLLNLNEFSFVD